MSYGCAKRRDVRRQSAIPRIEEAIDEAEKMSAMANIEAKEAKSRDNKAFQESAANQAKNWLDKVNRLSICLENTKHNIGKGTSALTK